MITGKNSIWKMLALFVLVLVAVLDIIFAQNRVVARINSILIAAELGWLVYNLYVKWSKKTYGDV